MVTHKSLSKVVPVRELPYAPENKFMSKADFVAKNRKRLEIEAKTKAFAEQLEKEAGIEPEVVEPIKAEAPVDPAPKPVKKYKKTV